MLGMMGRNGGSKGEVTRTRPKTNVGKEKENRTKGNLKKGLKIKSQLLSSLNCFWGVVSSNTNGTAGRGTEPRRAHIRGRQGGGGVVGGGGGGGVGGGGGGGGVGGGGGGFWGGGWGGGGGGGGGVGGKGFFLVGVGGGAGVGSEFGRGWIGFFGEGVGERWWEGRACWGVHFSCGRDGGCGVVWVQGVRLSLDNETLPQKNARLPSAAPNSLHFQFSSP